MPETRLGLACQHHARCHFGHSFQPLITATYYSHLTPKEIMKRVLLFVATNLAIMLVLSMTASLLGVNKYFDCKRSQSQYVARICRIDGIWRLLYLLADVENHCQVVHWRAGNSTSEQLHRAMADGHGCRASAKGRHPHAGSGDYQGEPNAFATGASKNNSLVAVSTGLLESMTRQEVEAVSAHEVAAYRQWRHGDTDLDPGGGQYLRHLLGARGGLFRRPGATQQG